MNFMKYYIGLILLLWQLPANAQIEFRSFEELLNYANINAFSIQQATINEHIALEEKREAGTYLLPTVGASLGYNDNITLQPTLVPAQVLNPAAPEGSFEELTFGTKFTYSRGLQAQWDILNFQKLFAYQTSKIGIKESKAVTEVNRFHTYNQLASTYYSILLTQESIQVYEENLQVGTSIYTHALQKYQEGVMSEAELNRSEIKKIQNKKSLDLAKSNLNQFYLQLQSQLNTDQALVVSDTPDNFKLYNTFIQIPHPEVVQQEIALEKYESLLNQTKAMRLPSLSLVYQNNQNWATDNFMDFSNANRLPQQVFGIQINLSGLVGLSTGPQIKQSKWRLQQQHLQLANTQLVTQQEDKLLQLQWEQASNDLKESNRILLLQKQNDTHSENRYQSGLISLDQRLDSYDDLLAAQDNYLKSLASLTLAQYKIYIRQINFYEERGARGEF